MDEKNNESYMDYLNSKIVNKNYTMTEKDVNDFNEARLLDEEGRYETIPVTTSTTPAYINPHVKAAFLFMRDYVKEKYNIILDVNYAYRTFAEQADLYNEIVATEGQKEADKKVAKPGESEHHTGLAIDVQVRKVMPKFVPNKPIVRKIFDRITIPMCQKKLWKVAPQFGFIQRYERGKEKLTGIETPEPWHYRYVGKETAEYMRKNGLTFEEYHKMQYDDSNTPEV